jgi:hypothetical protein
MVAAAGKGSLQTMTKISDTTMSASESASDVHPGPTVDQIFRRLVARHPDAVALVDPADKTRITGGHPRRLTYAEADRAVATVAEQLRHGGLSAGSVVAIQLANTIEFPVALLAVLRAGMVAAPMPQLWRQADLTDCLNRIGARGFICGGMIDGIDHGTIAMQAAAEVFSIRHVCGFGPTLPDGVTPLDLDMTPPASSADMADPRRPALITFDMTPQGRRVVPRTHSQLIAGSLAIMLECGLSPGGALLSTLAPSSFPMLATTFATWLLCGGKLVLHHPFDDDVLRAQLAQEDIETLALPGPLAARLADSGHLATAPRLRDVIAVWRNPENVAASPAWPRGPSGLTDVYAFGEIGLFAYRRTETGAPAPVRPGPYGAPHGGRRATVVGELLLTPRGTLALRGPMVPLLAYAAADADGPQPHPRDRFEPNAVDTGYAARLDRGTGELLLTAPPPGLIAVGGYRFLDHDLQALARNLGESAMLTGLPDRLNGYRLAGRAGDNRRARAALTELGINPLAVESFRDAAPAP